MRMKTTLGLGAVWASAMDEESAAKKRMRRSWASGRRRRVMSRLSLNTGGRRLVQTGLSALRRLYLTQSRKDAEI